MAFIDEVQLHITAGKGGDGVVRWRHEKHKPFAGPGGGNGGRGGNVFVVGVKDLSYLQNYQHQKRFAAEDGAPGRNKGEEGSNGEHLVMKFPIGSIITNLANDESIELLEENVQVLLLRGGRGGLGNEHFKTSTNRSPKESTLGKPGGEGDFHIELKLIADIGLVGLPSAGKSTLLNALTNAKSKVAEYHFTTLEPHLGVLKNGKIMADIPGLIEGASDGKGLGHKFLRHITRTKKLVHLISTENEDMATAYKTIRNELEKYDAELGTREEIILISKSDLVSEEVLQKKIAEIQAITSDTTIIKAITSYDIGDLNF